MIYFIGNKPFPSLRKLIIQFRLETLYGDANLWEHTRQNIRMALIAFALTMLTSF